MEGYEKRFLAGLALCGLVILGIMISVIPVGENYIGEITGLEIVGEHCIVAIGEIDAIFVKYCRGLDGSRLGTKLYKTSSIFGNDTGYKVKP